MDDDKTISNHHGVAGENIKCECGSEWFSLVTRHFKNDAGEDCTMQPAIAISNDGHVSAWGGQLACASCGKWSDWNTPVPPPKPELKVVT